MSATTALASDLLAALRARDVRLATVESCTAGGLALAFGRIPGASDVLWGGFVVYDNTAKSALGVSPALIQAHGAVSREVAAELAQAGLGKIPYSNKLCLATTGVAGPAGGSPEKPVGTCWLGISGFGRRETVLIQEPASLSRAELQDRFIARSIDATLSFVNAG